ncbi:hypothetical protein [Pelagicoccus sp. SDUM812003]|uniref:hypothetical protein n=1 Tax=Pelagicoccus sp. SDUM812003 TaxID=3041267 RepID=UPI00280EF251|nr:hypothetical protein [Pelagicoccus sp. SDUM812003]MDQ8201658.1 hypothetical protein [Pelagicoccus sp. SDUM812003]
MISAKKNNFIVEFRPSTIRAARTSSEAAPVVIEDLLEIDLASGGDVAGELRKFSGAKGSGYMHASAVVYPSQRLVRQLVLDCGRGKESGFVIDYLKNSAGVDPDTFSVYCLSAVDGSDADLSAFNKKSILLCGAPSSEISEIQKDMVEVGLYPRRLEIGTVGTIGFLKEYLASSDNTSPILFLEIDDASTNAVIVGANGVEMARRIDFGASHIASALKEEMSLKDESAAEKILQSRDFDLGPMAPKLLRKLLRELQSSIGFFEVQTGNSVSQLFCLKQGATLPWLETSISDLLNLVQLNVDYRKWLDARGVTFSSEELSGRIDATWVGALSLVMDYGKGGQSK